MWPKMNFEDVHLEEIPCFKTARAYSTIRKVELPQRNLVPKLYLEIRFKKWTFENCESGFLSSPRYQPLLLF
uniref:Ovule protein n=1 Tax=Strongyloides venezuelensis TaxID=75913 RepID=A0A0K0FKB6_STRVS